MHLLSVVYRNEHPEVTKVLKGVCVNTCYYVIGYVIQIFHFLPFFYLLYYFPFFPPLTSSLQHINIFILKGENLKMSMIYTFSIHNVRT